MAKKPRVARTSPAKSSSKKIATPRAPKVVRRTVGTTPEIGADERLQHIALGAYFRAEARGFAPGGELDDWLAAERDVDAALAAS
jgi:hypothetical protein